MYLTPKDLILIIFISFTFSNCKIYKKVKLPSQNGITGYLGNDSRIAARIAKSNKQKLKVYNGEVEFYPHSKDLKWGLAMSGGGIRSAAVNIGALKALRDLNILDSIQIISSVSGGSYASDWFQSNELNNKTSKLGYGFLDEQNFINKLCYLKGKGNMMTNERLFKNLFRTPNKAFNDYQNSIQRTFTNKEHYNSKINRYLSRKQKPYFIINTSIKGKRKNDWLSSIYEFTPYHQGNPEIGFLVNNKKQSINLKRAVAISGAAVTFKLLQNYPNHSKNVKSKYLPLNDGGKTENLGAVSLIRRVVKNIIIIDAEYDGKLKFKSYSKLKNKLKEELKLDFSVPEIDSLLKRKDLKLKKSVFKGFVKSIYLSSEYGKSPIEINIYYIKMAIPDTIEKVFNKSSLISAGENLSAKMKCSRGNNMISNSDFYKLSAYSTRSYSKWLNNKSKWRFLGYNFPQTTTFDQSFYRDQFAAFLGLGYMQTMELKIW